MHARKGELAFWKTLLTFCNWGCNQSCGQRIICMCCALIYLTTVRVSSFSSPNCQSFILTLFCFSDTALQFLDRMAGELGLPMRKIEVCGSVKRAVMLTWQTFESGKNAFPTSHGHNL